MSAKIIMYTTGICPYCVRARRLLDSKGVSYTDIRVDRHPERREEMETRSRRHTVPQIFIDDQHVGGCDELFALDRAGKLDPLLGRD